MLPVFLMTLQTIAHFAEVYVTNESILKRSRLRLLSNDFSPTFLGWTALALPDVFSAL
jgi:hypothetical protein